MLRDSPQTAHESLGSAFKSTFYQNEGKWVWKRGDFCKNNCRTRSPDVDGFHLLPACGLPGVTVGAVKSGLGAPVPVKHPSPVEGLSLRCSWGTNTKKGVILALIWRKTFTSVCGAVRTAVIRPRGLVLMFPVMKPPSRAGPAGCGLPWAVSGASQKSHTFQSLCFVAEATWRARAVLPGPGE